MAGNLIKTLSAAIIALSLSAPSLADIDDNLPDIGTTAGGTLTINQELIMGDYYLRQLRGGAPLIYDPLLTNYVNRLGQRLVAQADSVKTPFKFHLISNDEINAFAFFGGNVVIHSALFRETDNESQLASVMAHEIAHVTQRHLARAMEDQRRNAPIAWAGALGSILIAMANPEAGMAALTTTMAGVQQGAISFTQSNEQEADRIGIRILSRAGFSPQAMPEFMQKLADKYRYASKPPEILLTHPLPDSRLADTRNRANQLKATPSVSSQDYYLAKVRVLGMYGRSNSQSAKQIIYADLAKGNAQEKIAAQYGQAIDAYKADNPAQARQILQPLLTSQPNNAWFIDLMTDIDLSQNRYQSAISRLEGALKKQPDNAVFQLNLANAYIQAKQPTKAAALLNRYTFKNPEDVNGWDLLAKTSADLGLQDEEFAARAEAFALTGRIDQSLTLLTSASKQVKVGTLKQARYDARIDQLRQLQQRFRQFARS
jgi:predicted Zn-dependent protease